MCACVIDMERGGNSHKTVCHKTRLQVISKRRAANDCLSFDFEEETWKIDRFRPTNFLFFNFKVVFGKCSINKWM